MVEALDQSFGKSKRLLKNWEFQKVYSEGQKKLLPFFGLYWLKVSESQQTRVGLSVGRKIAGAVGRNRIKRVFRELIRTYPQPIPKGCWLVIAARRETVSVSTKAIREALYGSIHEVLSK